LVAGVSSTHLQREPDFLLRDELRNLPAYGAVLHALAHGAHRPTDIARRTGTSTAELHHYLKTLVELGYLERQTPLSGKPPSKRAVRYVVSDPLLRFHFRFLTRAAAAAALADPAHLYSAFVAPELDSFWGSCFEDLCREATARLLVAEGVALPHAVGRYWSPDVELDVVALRGDHHIDIGECKWGPVGRAAAWARSLRERSAHFPSGGNTLGYRLFTRAKLRSKPAGVLAHSLASLYGG
jgi:AAA+ ATPase superfamily predicted ATPase